MSKYIYTLLAAFLWSAIVNAQRDKTWHFGNGAGLTFSTSPPTILTSGQVNSTDNSSSISDLNGNLLFYTNGMSVWNKTHNVMPNGTGLTGHTSAGQCALIVPVPCEENKYVIFQTTEFAAPGHLKYSVVDMSLQNGMGDVVSTQKNISLGTGWTEKICAYYNAQGQFFWVLSHKFGTNEFVAFKVNKNSIATTSVVTQIGTVHNCGSYGGKHDAMGQLTISQDGSRVLNALTCTDVFELFDFDQNTGILTNVISLPGEGGGAWGTAFSPNNKKIYTNSIFHGLIYQYDISTTNTTVISNSKVDLSNITAGGYQFGYMELGPDNKLYIAKPNTSFLSVIGFPNLTGTAAGFTNLAQSIGSSQSSWGLSRIAYNTGNMQTSAQITVACSPSTLICNGQSVTLSASGASTYTWSNQIQTPSQIVTPSQTSTYTVNATGNCGISVATVSVFVTQPVKATTSKSVICFGQSATITASGATTYTWSNQVQSPSQVVTPSQTSIYTVNTTGGCGSGTATVTVIVSECTGERDNGELLKYAVIQPNPVGDYLQLKNALMPGDAGKLTILDMTGRVLQEQSSGSYDSMDFIDVSSLGGGIYYLLIQSADEVKTIKFIKQ